jgi:hypothetical protein
MTAVPLERGVMSGTDLPAPDSAPRATWGDALRWYNALEMGRRKVELNSIIRPALERLQQETADVPGLLAHYARGVEWVAEIAREGYPNTPNLWHPHRTADVAYALRFRQLTGQEP